jgi:hypothetical protein
VHPASADCVAKLTLQLPAAAPAANWTWRSFGATVPLEVSELPRATCHVLSALARTGSTTQVLSLISAADRVAALGAVAAFRREPNVLPTRATCLHFRRDYGC